jgi:hypothetical protein|tara:strand:- start:102 stop:587 length:486 start_codon:yes stop_codon:yes gene_type:complete
MNNMTFPQLLMMLNPGAANTTYLQPDQEAMLRNQSVSPYTPEGNVQMPNMQADSSGMATFLKSLTNPPTETGYSKNSILGPRTQTNQEFKLPSLTLNDIYTGITGLLGESAAGASVGSGPMTEADNDRMIDPRLGRRVNPAVGSGVMTDADATMLRRLYGN